MRPGLEDRVAAVQEGLTGVDGHSQSRVLLLPGTSPFARVCSTAAGKPWRGSLGCRAEVKEDRLLGAWAREGQLSQEMQLGAQNWDPTEVSGSSPLPQVKPQFRRLQTNLEPL